jgi:monoamine oxidase
VIADGLTIDARQVIVAVPAALAIEIAFTPALPAGCPVGHIAPGIIRANGAHLRSPHGPMHFAGTETADYWMGYMDGGVPAGERAAREVLRALKQLARS